MFTHKKSLSYPTVKIKLLLLDFFFFRFPTNLLIKTWIAVDNLTAQVRVLLVWTRSKQWLGKLIANATFVFRSLQCYSFLQLK